MRSVDSTSLESPSANTPFRSRLREVLAVGFLAGLSSCANTSANVKAPAELSNPKTEFCYAMSEGQATLEHCTKEEKKDQDVCLAELKRLNDGWSRKVDPKPSSEFELCPDRWQKEFFEERDRILGNRRWHKCHSELLRVDSGKGIGPNYEFCSDKEKDDIRMLRTLRKMDLLAKKEREKEEVCQTERERLMKDIDSKPGKELQACSKQVQETVLRKLPLRRAYERSSVLAYGMSERCITAAKTMSLEQLKKHRPWACRKHDEMHIERYRRFELFTGKLTTEVLEDLKHWPLVKRFGPPMF